MDPHETLGPEETTLHDGTPIVIRRIEKTDWTALVALHSRLSPRTRRLRFFTPKRNLRIDFARRLADVDFADRAAFVVTFPGEPDIRAVGRYERDGPDSVELAFVVEDWLQGMGIATHLMKHLEQHARANGFTRLHATVLAENSDMLEVFRHAGLPLTERRDRETIELEMELPAAEQGVAESPTPGPAPG